MTTFTVTSNADSGSGTLRADLAAASSGDTIDFAPNIGTIDLSTSLTINNSVTIEGGGTATPVVIDGGNQVTDFDVTGGNVVFDGLTIQNGHGVGLNASPYSVGSTNSAAGGIYETGYSTLTVSNSIFLNDTATGGMGENGQDYAPYSSEAGKIGGSAAGGIFVESTATLNLGGGNTFAMNSATGGVGGTGASSPPFSVSFVFVGPRPGGAGGAGGYAVSPEAGTGDGNGGSPGLPGSPGAPPLPTPIIFGNGQQVYAPGSGAGGSGGTAFADYGGNGTINVGAPMCFTTGSRICTARGDIPVENLKIGDVAVTVSGTLRPIVWIGRRDTDCRGLYGLQPIHVAAHAFGPGLPRRDLHLSPGHPVLIGASDDGNGGHLVPIMCLINGTTIERVSVDEVTYWHVELDEHDILLAEGLPAESYIDLGSRPWFDGVDGALHDPDLALPGMPDRCRPVAIDGPVVEAERRRLDEAFAMRLAAACAWPATEHMMTG